MLAMTSKHRGEVLQLDASLLKRTFTVREFARMLSVLENRGDTAPAGDITEFWRALPTRAASVRHLALPSDPADNDVVDPPYRRAEEVYHQMEDELAPGHPRHPPFRAPDGAGLVVCCLVEGDHQHLAGAGGCRSAGQLQGIRRTLLRRRWCFPGWVPGPGPWP